MASNPTVSDLFKSKDVSDEEVNAAVDAVLSNVSHGPYALAEGYAPDLKAAIQASTFATLIIADVQRPRSRSNMPRAPRS